MNASFYYNPLPAKLMSNGIDFEKVPHPDTSQIVIAIDNYFVPSVNIFNHSYVEI